MSRGFPSRERIHLRASCHCQEAMAVVKPTMFDDDDDDDVPLSFKRSNTSLKNRPTPSKQDSSSGNVTYVRNPKPVALVPHRNGMNGASRSPLPLKPQSTSSNPRPSGSGQPNSSTERNNHQKSNAVDKGKLKRSHVEDDKSVDSDDDRPLASRKKADTKFKKVDTGAENGDDSEDDHKPLNLKINSAKMASNNANKAAVTLKAVPEPQKPDDDSEDDHKPIGLKINSAKMASNNANKTVTLKATPKPQQSDDDSEDDKPLASRLTANAASKSAVKMESNDDDDDDDSEDEKPLASRFSRVTAGTSASISNSRDKLLSNNKASNVPRNPVKRPSDNNQTSSALKKAKPSDTSALGIVKGESKADDSTPLVRRLTTGESSKSKPSAKIVLCTLIPILS
uniref:Uncharacterized protein n=1 Tax=Avena sativa TaxID=4498 RepID=A0ACD6AT41_AVESA